ncbi:MAG: hypothetical protein R3E79_13645 [Caldilineaceae bacterium]
MANKTTREKAQPTEREETVEEPGRTPGQAEGEDTDTEPYDPAREPGRTPGQAEGDRETVEADLEEKTPKQKQRAQNAAASSSVQSPQPRPQQQTVRTQTAAQQRKVQTQQGAQRRRSDELLRWAALVAGGWLALFAMRRSLGSLMLIGLGGGLLYYALNKEWPTMTQQGTPRSQSVAM